MSKIVKSIATTVGAIIVAGIAGVCAAPAALAETPCPNAVGSDPLIVCTTVTPTTVNIPGGNTTVTVGGQTVGPVGGGTTTPTTTVTTPAVPLTSPAHVCFAVDCLEPGQTIATVPSESVTVPAIPVPLPVIVPSQTIPVESVTVPGSVSVPIPSVYVYNDAVSTLVNSKYDYAERTVNQYYNRYVPAAVRDVAGQAPDPRYLADCWTAYIVTGEPSC